MAKAKAKWLEATTIDLLALAAGIVDNIGTENESEKEMKKLPKLIAELQEREAANNPGDTVADQLGFARALSQKAIAATERAEELYNADLEAAGEIAPVDEAEAEPTEVEEAPKKKKSKKAKKAVEPTEDGEAEDDAEAGNDFESMTKKELKALAKERGFKVDKKASKEEIIELLNN